ncbi:DNA polymerase III subunit gamma/tau [Rhabdothermincola sediminis]|uniref:DNA polymerase III subunit gamma/tau n=1 Tax=Rhabdothermincola sediminis TaxID=2751370 RepID=UPI001AA08F9B|nr:DNA polymerase III subunit gamma/tau [Rhabdothermincola sediminis]
MAYQSLYRRYRPQRFSEVRGQEHLVRALQNAVRENRVGHAYLFSGPRGTGKTSTARILAKVLNCEHPVDGEPCCACESCVAIEQGTSFDVHELDAASNNKVEDIRELVNKAALGTPGRTKVYILDEVHMLTQAASNALLKTLEEPPEHVVFVLATTDPQKVLPTVRSRCQPFEVRLLSADELRSLAEYIVKDAGLDVSPEAIDYVVRVGAGSARDMESALDQVVAAGGIPDDGDTLDELVEALCERDTGRALLAVDQAIAAGRSPRVVGEQLVGRLRDVFLAAVGADLSRLDDRARERVTDQAARLTAPGATRALEVIGEAFVGIQDAPDPRIPLEVALVRLTRDDAELSLAALADRVARLERGGTAPRVPGGAGSEGIDGGSDPGNDVEGAASEGAGAAAGTGRRGPRPADGAREALAQRRRASQPQERPRPPAAAGPSARPSPARALRDAAPAPPSTPTPPAAAGSPGGAADDLPSRDELTLAWGDTILASLSNRARSRFAGGRFITVEGGAAVFGLPNVHHARRCEEVREEVEQALASHFARPVPLRVVVDEGGATVQGGSATVPDPEPDEEISLQELSELTDATDVATSGLERIAEIFPGAELVDGGDS